MQFFKEEMYFIYDACSCEGQDCVSVVDPDTCQGCDY